MSEQEGGLSRRNFIQMVGAAGGATAVHETLIALGLMRPPSAWAGPPKCNPNLGKGKKVVILGAGVGGLATAYWLRQSGYNCVILEAQDRLGGRSHTARSGDKVYELDPENPNKVLEQECKFDDDPRLYVNLGPGRIPYHHRRVIELCKELEVALEVYVHTSDFNFHFMKNARRPMNRALVRRRIANDTQGYIAELLAKAVNQKALDHELLGDDKEKLLSLLRKFGDLNNRYRYKGSTRAGCEDLPVDVKTYCSSDALDSIKPLGLDVLLESRFWDTCLVGGSQFEGCSGANYGFYQVKEHLWQTTSFQPVGGMDKIVEALEEALKKEGKCDESDKNGEYGKVEIRCEAEVKRVALVDGGSKVRIRYKKQNGVSETADADFCVSNIPLTVLKGLDTPDFDNEFKGAVDRGQFSNGCKVGWQANRRFWEKDDHMYGGISWTDHDITQMWYPSNDYFWKRKKGEEQKGVGVLTGAYNYNPDTAERFGNLSFQKRLDEAYKGGALLHPQAFDARKGKDADVPKDLGISIAWQHVRFQQGCSARWNRDNRQDELDYERLLVPDMKNRFFIVGDQASTLPGWQEGALMSAEHVVNQITTGEDLDLYEIRRQINRAPSSLEVMG